MFDYHIHTDISFDSTARPKEIAEAAIRQGLEEICFTNHHDYCPPGQPQTPAPDMDRYQREFAELAGRHLPIRLKFGIEIGTTAETWQPFDAFVRQYDFDFVIFSQHCVGEMDPYYPPFFEKWTRAEAYRAYLEETIRTLERFVNFDVLGHIGYVSKYCPDPDRRMRYSEFPELFDRLLGRIIDLGKGIELNTSSFESTGDFQPAREILCRYRELGGEIVTLGSDAHTPDRVGYMFREALAALKGAGFSHLCTFTGRVPTFHKI